MRRLLSLTVAVLSVTAVLAVPFVTAAVQSFAITPGDQVSATCSTSASVHSTDAQHVTVLCAAPPTPAPTPAPAPTTVTSSSGTSTATSVNGTPLCGVTQADGKVYGPAHDATKWHLLLVRNANGSVLCTYGHEHGMNPAVGDAVFGALPLSQQISYPWATISPTGLPENGPEIKHRVYKWLVAPSLACSIGQYVDGTSKMVTAFREELHADGNLGAAIRFHSYWGQYQVTDCAHPSDKGYISVGGHMDYANLTLGPAPLNVPLHGDPPASCAINGDSRHEGIVGGPAQNGIWYGQNAHGTRAGASTPCDDANPDTTLGASVQLNIATDSWGPVDPANPLALQFYANRSEHHGTRIATDALTLWLGNGYLWKKAGYMDANGYVNFTGHANRHGAMVPEVAGQPAGPDYIPLVISHAKPGAYGANGARLGGGLLQHQPVGYDGDVAGPNGLAGYYVKTPSL